jgi:hypothetical protein
MTLRHTHQTPASFPIREDGTANIFHFGRLYSPSLAHWSYLMNCRAPGLKFGFTGEQVAITFGPSTSDSTLVGYRIDGQDWQFTNITTNATHLLVSSATPGVNLSSPVNPSSFELRVTNWAYGVQIAAVHVAAGGKLVQIPNFKRSIEVIGDSLSSGYSATLEGLSSYAYGVAAGLGETEYSITAYPGICLYNQPCFGNSHGMFYQWFYTSDTSGRETGTPELWDFSRQQPADIVLINLGTNDANPANDSPDAGYVAQYIMLIEGIHAIWPNAQVILIVCPKPSLLLSQYLITFEKSLYGTALVRSEILMCKLLPSFPRSIPSTSTSTR